MLGRDVVGVAIDKKHTYTPTDWPEAYPDSVFGMEIIYLFNEEERPNIQLTWGMAQVLRRGSTFGREKRIFSWNMCILIRDHGCSISHSAFCSCAAATSISYLPVRI